MNLAEALGIVVPRLTNELVIHANGFISRQSFALRDRAENFYMIGSMGLASSIGLGVALARPRRRVVVFDGDGNVLMNLGSLVMAGALKPANYFHLCFDNGVYGSTGNQRAVSAGVDLERLAAAAGYRMTARVSDPGGLDDRFREWRGLEGPRFLLVRIEPDRDERPLPRIEPDPVTLAERFRAACAA